MRSATTTDAPLSESNRGRASHPARRSSYHCYFVFKSAHFAAPVGYLAPTRACVLTLSYAIHIVQSNQPFNRRGCGPFPGQYPMPLAARETREVAEAWGGVVVTRGVKGSLVEPEAIRRQFIDR